MTRALAGAVLCGRYRILDALGTGGMASVWRGEQVSTGLLVAIKIILRELLEAPGAAQRFQSEAKAVAQLRAANVVRIIDYDVDPEAGPFIVVELLEGETLGARLERGYRLSPPELLRLFKQIGRGLDHAHRSGIVHRDLKPDNVFLARDERGGHVVKLLDFGVAKNPLAGAQSSLTTPGHLVGTIAYMSPEQALGKEVDHRSDLWSLGVIAYECLVGQVPFAGDTIGMCLLAICTLPLPIPSITSPGLPYELDAWFAKACARATEDRFASCAEMISALESACATQPRPRTQANLPPPTTADEHADGGYYVAKDDVKVGPVSAALLKRGIGAKKIPGDALVWREGWPEWRLASSLAVELAIVAAAPAGALGEGAGLEAVGTRSILPPSAPATEKEPTEDGEPAFYVTTGDTTVGPVTRDLLLRGIDAGRVPETALVWREGWSGWHAAALVRAWMRDGALVSAPSAGGPELADRPGLEALGKRSVLPPSAPPSMADPGDVGPEDAVFHVWDGQNTVGPITGTVLTRGAMLRLLPEGAMVWREGWGEWRRVADVVWELGGVRMPRSSAAPGPQSARALGSPSMLPPGAPSTPPSTR
ncbi:MAG TPA: protein kinase [Polyangiaceae bacterium]